MLDLNDLRKNAATEPDPIKRGQYQRQLADELAKAELADPLFQKLQWAITHQSTEHTTVPLNQWRREAKSAEENGAISTIESAIKRNHWKKAQTEFDSWAATARQLKSGGGSETKAAGVNLRKAVADPARIFNWHIRMAISGIQDEDLGDEVFEALHLDSEDPATVKIVTQQRRAAIQAISALKKAPGVQAAAGAPLAKAKMYRPDMSRSQSEFAGLMDAAITSANDAGRKVKAMAEYTNANELTQSQATQVQGLQQMLQGVLSELDPVMPADD